MRPDGLFVTGNFQNIKFAQLNQNFAKEQINAQFFLPKWRNSDESGRTVWHLFGSLPNAQ